MAINTYRFWMATDANRLLANQNAFIQASAPSFYQGNVAQLELHIVASAGVGTSPIEVPFPAGAAISVAVGDTNTYPTGGTWGLMVGTTETESVPYNATTAQVAAALNALTEVSSVGGVTVTKTGDGYSITWNTYGLKPTIGIGSDTLTPSSYESISLVQEGSAERRQIVFVELRQNPIALGTTWTALPTPSVTVSEIQAWNGINRIWRVSIEPQPKAGTITISYGTKTATLAFNASASSIAAALSPAQVFATGQYQWDIVIAQDSVLTASGSLVGYNGFSGSINFATAECHQFLAGAERRATVLEVSVSVDSKRYTLIQTVCNVFADVVSDGVLVPLVLGTAISEQVANARFVRRDIDQNPNSATQNVIWQNLGVETIGSDVVGAIDNSDSPSAANPFATISDLSGLGATWGSITGTLDDQTDLQTVLINKIDEAPIDNAFYGRQNGQWQDVGYLGYATESFVTSQGYITSSALTGYAQLSGATFTGGVNIGTGSFIRVTDGYIDLTSKPIISSESGQNSLTISAGVGFRQNGVADSFVTSADHNGFAYANYDVDGNVVNVATLTGLSGLSVQNSSGESMVVNGSYIRFKDNTTQSTAAYPFNGGYVYNPIYVYTSDTDTWGLSIVPNGIAMTSQPGFYGANSASYTDAGMGASLASPSSPSVSLTCGSGLSILENGNTTTVNNGVLLYNGVEPYSRKDGTTFTGKVNLATIGVANPSINLGGQCDSAPASATNGDIWISNAASPKLTYKMGGVNYNLPVLNQFNTFTNQMVIDTSSATTSALRVTQRGAGNAIEVEDQTSPDSTKFVVDQFGKVGVGTAPDTTAAIKVDANGISFNGLVFNPTATAAHTGGPNTLDLLVTINGTNYRINLRPA